MKKRILFVDDEEILRELYQALEPTLGVGYEIVTAPGGSEALCLLKEQRFDVVVSDLAMPQMDGLEFLSAVVRDYPESARVVISGFADQLKVAECLTLGHRFFTKPFNVKALVALLKRVCQYSYLLQDEKVRRLVCSGNALPSPPELYLRLTEALNSEYCDIDEIGRIVEMDPGVSIKLLQLVNSAQFGIAREVARPAEAVQIIGLEVLRALVFGTKVFDFYERSPLVQTIFKELWRHCLSTAMAARKLALAERLSMGLAEECFQAGLLHDVGKLVLMANAESDYKRVIELARSGIPVHDAEQQVFHSTHAQVGAYLLALWGVSDGVIQAVEMHHSVSGVEMKSFGPLLAVHVAQHLVDPARVTATDERALEQAGLLGRLSEWKMLVDPRSTERSSQAQTLRD